MSPGIFDVLLGVGKLASRAGSAGGRAAANGMATRQMSKVSKAARRGLIGPTDPPPPPSMSGLKDYRALALPGDFAPVGNTFPLGRYRLPAKNWELTETIGLSEPDVNKHVAVLGPTRSGKTYSVFAPWMYQGAAAGYCVIAVDAKGSRDLIREYEKYAAEQSPLPVPIRTFDVHDPKGSVSWNWIGDLNNDTAINAAVEAICGKATPGSQNQMFDARDRRFLRGLLELAQGAKRPVTARDLQEVLSDQSRLEQLIRARRGNPGVNRVRELLNYDPDRYSLATTGVAAYLDTLDRNEVLAVTTKPSLRISDLVSEPGVFVVSAPVSDGELSATLTGLMFSQILGQRMSMFGQDLPPVLLLLDEAPRVQKRIDLATLLSVGAGAGISVVLGIQDVGQFDEESRDEILSNCGTAIAFPGSGSATTKWFAERIGNYGFATQTLTQSSAHAGPSTSLSVSNVDRAALGHNEISAPPFDGYPAIVHAKPFTTKPFLIDLTRYSPTT